MISSPDNLSIIIGASPRVDSLRRLLRRSGFANLGIATCLPGLRRELITGEDDLIVSCILLDEPTVMQSGEALRDLLADAQGFHSALISIGLVPDPMLMPKAMSFGCHFYLEDFDRVASSIRALSGHWRENRPLRQSGSKSRSPETLVRRKAVSFPNRLNSLSSPTSSGKTLVPVHFDQPPINRIRDWFERNQSPPDRLG